MNRQKKKIEIASARIESANRKQPIHVLNPSPASAS